MRRQFESTPPIRKRRPAKYLKQSTNKINIVLIKITITINITVDNYH